MRLDHPMWIGGSTGPGVSRAGRASATRPAGPGPVRRVRACVLALMAANTLGCYVYRPVPAAPAPGTRLALELNDRGRVALADSVGPSADLIEGSFVSRTDSAYVVHVKSVRYINRQTHPWTNEPLTVRSALLRDIRERRLSRGRTALVASAAVGGVVAFLLSTDLLGSGSVRRPQPGDGTGVDQ
jgi:hypothetical protein